MSGPSRFFEIDLFRGIAIGIMVLFHTLFDLIRIGICPVTVTSGFWKYFAFATTALFLLLVGISFTISYARAAANLAPVELYLKFLKRGAGIFALGLLVTLVTWLCLGEDFIVFGILHLIGVSVILAPLFYRFERYNLALGIVFILLGYLLAAIPGPAWLLPLGMHPAAWISVDYEPLFPWFGVVLAGLGIGSILYPGGARSFSLPEIPERWERILTFPGKHSLLIYLVHQPVIILFLYFTTDAVPF
ncbi:MAG: DUF1624 domain-containing protein [Methanoregula sp.]|nr:DUF1624 domain-containing protein [Methanoregula sp.]